MVCGGKMSVKLLLGNLARALPWLALGPLTGLLGWRMGRSMEAKNRTLAILYGVSIVTTSAALALWAGHALTALIE
jgi:hypothetical protein